MVSEKTKTKPRVKGLLIGLGISVAWIVMAYILFAVMGESTFPHGGLDDIGEAIAIAFLWNVFIWGPPIVIAGVTLLAWLIKYHKKWIKFILIGLAVIGLGVVCYVNFGKQLLASVFNTPENVARKIDSYSDWYEYENEHSYGLCDGWTEYDFICEYVNDELKYDTLAEMSYAHPDADDALETEYINAAMEKCGKDIPHLVRWEYVTDVTSLIPPRQYTAERYGSEEMAEWFRESDKDGYLIYDDEFPYIEDHFGMPLNQDHEYPRYQNSASSFIYSYSKVIVLFYDNGTFDIV